MHPWYPNSALSEECAEFRKVLNSAVLYEAFSTSIEPEEESGCINCTGTAYESSKGIGEPVCLTQVPFTSVFEVTE